MQFFGARLCCLLLCLLGVTGEKTLRNQHPAHKNRKALLQEKTEPQELSDHDLIEEVLGGNVPSEEWEDSAHAAKKARDVQLAKETLAVPAASPAAYDSASPAAWQAASPAMEPAIAPAMAPVMAPAAAAPAPAAAAPMVESLGDWLALLWQSIMDWLFPAPPAPKPPSADQVANLDKATFAPASHEDPEEDSTFAPPGGDGAGSKKKKRGHKGLDETEQKTSLMQNGKMDVAPAKKAVKKASWWWWAWPFAPTTEDSKKEGSLQEARVAALSGGTMIQSESDEDNDDDDSA